MIEGWWLPQEEGQVPPHHGHHGGPARQGGGHIHRGEYKKYRNILYCMVPYIRCLPSIWYIYKTNRYIRHSRTKYRYVNGTVTRDSWGCFLACMDRSGPKILILIFESSLNCIHPFFVHEAIQSKKYWRSLVSLKNWQILAACLRMF